MHDMNVLNRNDGGEDEGLEDMTLTQGITSRRTNETVPRSLPLRKRYLVLAVLAIGTTVAILYYAVSAAQRPEETSSRSSSTTSASTSVSNSGSNNANNRPQNTLPPEVMPTGQPSLFPLDDVVQAAPSTQPSLFPIFIDAFTEPPSIQPTLFPLNDVIQACLDQYQCQSDHPDRMGHETPLYVGNALCNDHLRFGLTPSGVFQWHNCDTAETKIIYDDAIDRVSYFSMSSTGVFRLFDQSDAIVWQKEPLTKITFSAQCIHQPLLDCPYLHLHKSGDVVLNSVDATNGWSNRKIEKSFDDLFH